jgi:hypothetical protein
MHRPKPDRRDVTRLIGYLVGRIAMVVFLLIVAVVLLVTVMFVAAQLFVFLIKQYVGE